MDAFSQCFYLIFSLTFTADGLHHFLPPSILPYFLPWVFLTLSSKKTEISLSLGHFLSVTMALQLRRRLLGSLTTLIRLRKVVKKRERERKREKEREKGLKGMKKLPVALFFQPFSSI